MKFRKKPVVIDAWLWDETKDTFELLKSEGMKYSSLTSHSTENYIRRLRIKTLEGPLNAEKGDMIIRGVNAEFYPCKPDIFEKTYERVEQ